MRALLAAALLAADGGTADIHYAAPALTAKAGTASLYVAADGHVECFDGTVYVVSERWPKEFTRCVADGLRKAAGKDRRCEVGDYVSAVLPDGSVKCAPAKARK